MGFDAKVSKAITTSLLMCTRNKMPSKSANDATRRANDATVVVVVVAIVAIVVRRRRRTDFHEVFWRLYP